MSLIQKPYVGIKLNKSHPFTNGLVGCWVMNEGTGDKVLDLSGNGRDGSLINNAAWANTTKGRGLEFPTNNGSDRVDLGSITSANPLSGIPTGEISIVARVYISSSFTNNYGRIFDKSNGGNFARGWGLYHNVASNVIRIYVAGASVSQSSPIFTGWHDVVCTLKSGQLRFYLNGLPDTSSTNAFTFSSVTTNAAIGNWNHSTDRQWSGYINHVYIYDRILIPSEVAWLHREPYAMFQYDMPAWMFYTEVSGVTMPVFMSNYLRQMGA